MKKLSYLMLVSNLLTTLFYSLSYPYIYAETVKIVPKAYISIEQILACVGTIVFCRMWNKHSDKLFKHYRKILLAEMIADSILFADVIIRNDMSFYFLLNVIIYAVITKNLSCGGTKMRAIINQTEKEREIFDNNSNIINSVATLLGTAIAMGFNFTVKTLFICAFIGNVIDNIFYLYIYQILSRKRSDSP